MEILMTSPRTRGDVAPYWPRLLNRRMAAAYCGVCENTFDRLVKEGVLPKSRAGLGRKKTWDRLAIDAKIDGAGAVASAEAKALGALDAL